MQGINNNDKDKDTKAEIERDFDLSIEMAEARIEQALIRYELAVGEGTPSPVKEKVRL